MTAQHIKLTLHIEYADYLAGFLAALQEDFTPEDHPKLDNILHSLNFTIDEFKHRRNVSYRPRSSGMVVLQGGVPIGEILDLESGGRVAEIHPDFMRANEANKMIARSNETATDWLVKTYEERK